MSVNFLQFAVGVFCVILYFSLLILSTKFAKIFVEKLLPSDMAKFRKLMEGFFG